MADPTFTLAGEGAWGAELGEVLSEDEALKILRDRIKHAHGGEIERFMQRYTLESGHVQKSENLPDQITDDLLRKIIRMLPDEGRTAVVLGNVDMRQLLAPVMSTLEDAPERVVNGQTIRSPQQYIAGLLYTGFEEDTLKELKDAYLETGKAKTDEEALKKAQEELDRRKGLAPGTLIPINAPVADAANIDPTTGQRVTTEAGAVADPQQQMADILAGLGADAPVSFLSPEDLALLARDEDPTYVFGRYMADLSARQSEFAKGNINAVHRDETSLDLGEFAPTITAPHGTGSMEQIEAVSKYTGPSGGGYTLTQAKDQLRNMTSQELRALSDKMKAAGIYDEINQPDGPVVLGSSTDLTLKKAWTHVLAKMLQQPDKPLPQILAEQAAAKALTDKDKDKKGTRITYTDPAALRIAADTIGQAELGRGLTKDEKAKLVQFIHGLEKVEGQQTSAVENNPETGGERTAVDWQAQMTEYIQRNNPEESAAKDVANEYDTFAAMLGPAGTTTQLPSRNG